MSHLIRTAFVTGGAEGLGKAFTRLLLQQGARVCFADIQVSKGRDTESELKSIFGDDSVLFCPCDVTSVGSLKESFKYAIQKLGHLDLMVNNAGIADESNFVRMININLIAAIHGTQLAMDHMRKDKGGLGGRIINVASTAGLTGVYFSPNYCASKYGLVGYHQSMSANPHNSEMRLQFGCLCPAFTDTAIIDFDPLKVDYLDEAQTFVKKIGINKVENVVEGFMRLINSDDCNGDIVTITTRDGVQVINKTKRKPRASL